MLGFVGSPTVYEKFNVVYKLDNALLMFPKAQKNILSTHSRYRFQEHLSYDLNKWTARDCHRTDYPSLRNLCLKHRQCLLSEVGKSSMIQSSVLSSCNLHILFFGGATFSEQRLHFDGYSYNTTCALASHDNDYRALLILAKSLSFGLRSKRRITFKEHLPDVATFSILYTCHQRHGNRLPGAASHLKIRGVYLSFCTGLSSTSYPPKLLL